MKVSTKIVLAIVGAIVLATGLALAHKAYSLYSQLKDPEPLVFWAANNPDNPETIDHSIWQQLLNNYVVEDKAGAINLFNYGGVSDEHYQDLLDYLDAMQAIDPRDYHPDEQMAYWINLYNAVTIQVILDEYPVESIKQTGDGLPGLGPWEDKRVEIVGQQLSLNNIEHGILRRVWSDNRIHYGVNCASIGCPDLAKTAYTRANLHQALDASAKSYVNNARGVTFIQQDGKDVLQLSSIFNWFMADFGGNETALLNDLQQYATPALKNKLTGYTGEIQYAYDWSLNDVTLKTSASSSKEHHD